MTAHDALRIAVLGAGAWGTALACHAALRHPVWLWTRQPAHAEAMRSRRANARYLPDINLPVTLHCVADLEATLRWVAGTDHPPQQGLLVLATALSGMRPVLAAVARAWPSGGAAPMGVWLSKGIERDTGLLPHHIAADVLPMAVFGPLSGPSFAQEVAAGLPVALTVATDDDGLAHRTVRAFHFGAARIYRSDDRIGVELGGALKNVVAVATGICDGLSLGANARAALVTRGLAEITRLGLAMGAKSETFMGLTGLGDLVLTCTGELSRNRRVGLALAAGRSLDQVLAELGHVAEGVACVDAARELGRRHRVELPIVEAVAAVLGGRRTPHEAVGALLAREPKREH
jgi:glycerol-3-phosphate dehydrogenase (NAD(P)+)